MVDRSIGIDRSKGLGHALTPPRAPPPHTHDSHPSSAAAATTTGEGGASRLSVMGAGGDDEGDALVRLVSEHWEDLFDAEEDSEGSEEGAKVLDASELVARIEEGKKNLAKRCVGECGSDCVYGVWLRSCGCVCVGGSFLTRSLFLTCMQAHAAAELREQEEGCVPSALG